MLSCITKDWLMKRPVNLRPDTLRQTYLYGDNVIKIINNCYTIILEFCGSKVTITMDAPRYEGVVIRKLDSADPSYFDDLADCLDLD